jgi:hypothetical protein
MFSLLCVTQYERLNKADGLFFTLADGEQTADDRKMDSNIVEPR